MLPMLLLFGLLIAVARADHKDNTIFNELLEKGIPISNGNTIVIQQPVMADGLNAAAQQKVIAGLVAPKSLKSFLGGDRNAYSQLNIGGKPGTGENPATGRVIDLYFIANAKLETVGDKNFMKQQFGGGNGKAAFLTAQELKARNLTVVDNEKIRERYAHADFDLFNLVQIYGTGHGIQTHTQDSEVVAFILDPRFAEDPKYPNQWKPIKPDPRTGKAMFGDPKPYQAPAPT